MTATTAGFEHYEGALEKLEMAATTENGSDMERYLVAVATASALLAVTCELRAIRELYAGRGDSA